LIEEKLVKESQKYIKSWDTHDIHIENGRWGAFIRHGKKAYKLVDLQGKKIDADKIQAIELEEIIKIAEAQGAKFKKPKSVKSKK
jgi:DNA topoisomerase-1